ncbi:MAG: hypothetical protein H5T83_06870 [Actinotalea sp.]|nr:hypothetical protein [Actinotalea sp.]
MRPTRAGTDPAAPPWGSVEERPLPWAPMPARPEPAEGPARASEPEPEPEPDAGVGDEQRSPYTWLQVLGLVVVAFVLGVLIYFVLVQGGDPGAAASLLDPSAPVPQGAAASGVPAPADATVPIAPFETGA